MENIRLSKNLRLQFYKDFKENTFSKYHIKLKDLKRRLRKKIVSYILYIYPIYNHISAIIEHQKKHLRVYQRGSERENKLTHRTFGTLGAFDSQTNKIRCWLCNQNHKISECTQLTALPVDDRLKLVKENRLCFNCLSNSHMIKECKSKVCCRIDSCSKRHHTLLHPPSDNSTDGSRSYQNYHHSSDSHNTETFEPPNETEATVHTQIVKSHTFSQVILIKSNGSLSVETNTLLDCGSDN